MANSHVFIDISGRVKANYRKAHLFNVDIPDRGVRLKESDYVVAGQDIVDPIDMLRDGYFHVGLATCYDLRFSEMSTIQRQRGANVLTFPSAFTVATGAAGHWSH